MTRESSVTLFQLMVQSPQSLATSTWRQISISAEKAGNPSQSTCADITPFEETTLQNMQDFGDQQITNTLLVMMKQRQSDRDGSGGRSRRAISGKFNSQEVANMRRFGKHRTSTTMCFMCDLESSYVYSHVCEKTECLGENLVL